ncbi:MAG TPA: hypothetical protein VGK73_02835 [Polyangiaceae bacterium]
MASGAAGAPPRLVTAASCEELEQVAALFIALSIDPTLHVESPQTFPEITGRANEESGTLGAPSAGEPNRPAPPAERDEAPPRSATRPAEAAPLRVRPLAAASAAFALGALPGLAVGVSGEGGVALNRLSLRALLRYFPRQHVAVTPQSGGDLTLAVAGARAVYALAEGVPEVALSAGVTLGWMHGSGTGVQNRDSGDLLLIAFEPGARAGYAVAPSFRLVADAALTLRVNRPRFVLEGIGEVHQPSRVGGEFGLGAEWCPP